MRQISAEAGIDEEAQAVTETGEKVKMEPAVRKSFMLILISIFLWFMGYNAVISAFSRYAANMWGEDLGGTMMILLVAQAAAIITFLPSGFVATKFGRKNTILIGIVLLAIGFGTAFIYTEFTNLIYLNFILAGIGWAFINVNSLPMVVDMSKGPNVGKYTGYYYFFSMSAQIITPWLSGVFIAQWGYNTLFPYSCVFVLTAFITMMMVKHGDTRPQAPKPGLESFDVDD
jgi:MFS family permease